VFNGIGVRRLAVSYRFGANGIGVRRSAVSHRFGANGIGVRRLYGSDVSIVPGFRAGGGEYTAAGGKSGKVWCGATLLGVQVSGGRRCVASVLGKIR